MAYRAGLPRRTLPHDRTPMPAKIRAWWCRHRNLTRRYERAGKEQKQRRITDEARAAIVADPRKYITIAVDYGISDSYVQKLKREAKEKTTLMRN
jgi:hypothetical protein